MSEPASKPWRSNEDGAQEQDSSASEVQKETVEYFDGTQKSPWKVLEFHDISYANAIIQHPSDVIRNFRRLSKLHHPDKCSDPDKCSYTSEPR